MEGIEITTNLFHWVDYLIFVLFIVISLGFGVFAKIMNCFKKQTAKDFLAGSRDMSLFPVTLAILSSLMSAILITGTPAEVYLFGTQIFLMGVGGSVGCLLAAALFVPFFYPLKVTSPNEIFQLRYNSKWPKLAATGLLIIQQLITMGIAAFAPATALESLTGFPTWLTIIVGGAVALVYTAMGGLKASIWAGAFQTVIMAAGVIAVIIKGSIDVGGMTEVWKINVEGGRVNFFDFDPNPLVRQSFWSLIVGLGISYSFQYGYNPAAVQRYCAMPTLRLAQWSILLNIPGFIFFMVLVCLAGMVIYAYYAKVRCDPLRSRYVDNPNQLVAYFVLDRIGYPGVPGLFLASLFSGSLSTVSASLSALAALTYQDIIVPVLPSKLSVQTQTRITQGLVVLYGLIGIGTAFMAATLGGTVLQAALSFVGATGGPLLGMIYLAVLFPCSHWQGVIIGAVISLAFCLWLSFGGYFLGVTGSVVLNTTTEMCLNATSSFSNVTRTVLTPDQVTGYQRLYLVSYLWYPSIGLAVVVVVGLLISCATGLENPKNVPLKFQISIFDKLFCCLPNKTLKVLRCNRDYLIDDTDKTENDQEDSNSICQENDQEDSNSICDVTPPPYEDQITPNGIPIGANGQLAYINSAIDMTYL